MWTQTISIYGKNVGTKSNQKLLITILNNDYFKLDYYENDKIILINNENTSIDCNEFIVKLSKEFENDTICINDRFIHNQSQIDDNEIKEDNFDFYRNGEKIARLNYKYKKAEVLYELDSDGCPWNWYQVYFKKPKAKFYDNKKSIDEKKFFSLFSNEDLKTFDEIFSKLKAADNEVTSLWYYIDNDEMNIQMMKAYENKLLSLSGKLVNEVNKKYKKKNKYDEILYNSNGETTKELSIKDRHKILGLICQCIDAVSLYENEYDDWDDYDKYDTSEYVEFDTFFRKFNPIYSKMIEEDLDFKSCKELLKVMISYAKNNSYRVIELVLLEKQYVLNNFFEILKNDTSINKFFKGTNDNDTMKKLKRIEACHRFFKPTFVGTISRKDLQNINYELISFCGNPDGTPTPYDDVYVCIDKKDVDAIKGFINKSLKEFEYMGPKDQNISLYTIDYQENEDFYDEIYSEDNPLYD